MSGDIGIGKLIDQERGRDAIHVAVAPVVAAYPLLVGSHVCILPDGKAGYGSGSIGIVDPFLSTAPKAGDRFYLFLYPGSITSLRHEWVHSAFQDAVPVKEQPRPDKAFAESWLRQYAARVNKHYEPERAYHTLLTDLGQGTITYHGTEMHSRSELLDGEELRRYAEVVLGKSIDFGNFEYFSCSC